MTGDVVTHIVVMGLMGAGKTTVGARLAALLDWPLRDSDTEIERATSRTVRELRDEIGVDAMHDLEIRQLVDALAAPGPAVVCPAAFVIESEACVAALRGPGIAAVFLTAAPAVSAARFVSGAHRPWYGTDPEVFLADQAASRNPRFRSVNPMELATDDRTPDELAAAVIRAVSARGTLAGSPAADDTG